MSNRSVVPGYLRPPPGRVLRLPSSGWTAVVIIVLLALVELYARSSLASPLDIVPVSDMVIETIRLFGDREFLVDSLGRTLGVIAISFAVSSVLGIAAAYLLWRFDLCKRAFRPYLNVYYAVPTFALYPIMVVLFGSGITPIAVLSTVFAFGIVTVNAQTGFEATTPIIGKLGRVLRMTRWQYFRSILLPYALPNIITGLKLGLSYAIISVLASEFILSTDGLGHYISIAYDSFDIAEMYAGILVVTALALLATLLISAVLNRFDWRRRR